MEDVQSDFFSFVAAKPWSLRITANSLDIFYPDQEDLWKVLNYPVIWISKTNNCTTLILQIKVLFHWQVVVWPVNVRLGFTPGSDDLHDTLCSSLWWAGRERQQMWSTLRWCLQLHSAKENPEVLVQVDSNNTFIDILLFHFVLWKFISGPNIMIKTQLIIPLSL